MSESNDKIILYTSNSCLHAWVVSRFMHNYEIPLQSINIDEVPGARSELIQMNQGYASVPTLIFPDGTRMVEPSLSQLRQKLGLQSEGILDQILGFLRN